MAWRRHVGVVFVLVVVAAVGSTFLSWGVSGSVGRSSYELVDSSRALGLLDDGLLRYAPAWFGLPFLAAVAVVAIASGRFSTAAVLGVVAGASLISGWLIVKSSPVRVDTGATVGALLGATLVVVGSLLLILEGVAWRDRQTRRTRTDGSHRERGDDAPSGSVTTTPAGVGAGPRLD